MSAQLVATGTATPATPATPATSATSAELAAIAELISQTTGSGLKPSFVRPPLLAPPAGLTSAASDGTGAGANSATMKVCQTLYDNATMARQLASLQCADATAKASMQKIIDEYEQVKYTNCVSHQQHILDLQNAALKTKATTMSVSGCSK